jgi:hypothetical protein
MANNADENATSVAAGVSTAVDNQTYDENEVIDFLSLLLLTQYIRFSARITGRNMFISLINADNKHSRPLIFIALLSLMSFISIG